MEVKLSRPKRKSRAYTPSTQRIFTDSEICYIRHAINVEERSTREVGKEMNASHHVIWCIANGTTYKEVECEY